MDLFVCGCRLPPELPTTTPVPLLQLPTVLWGKNVQFCNTQRKTARILNSEEIFDPNFFIGQVMHYSL